MSLLKQKNSIFYHPSILLIDHEVSLDQIYSPLLVTVLAASPEHDLQGEGEHKHVISCTMWIIRPVIDLKWDLYGIYTIKM